MIAHRFLKDLSRGFDRQQKRRETMTCKTTTRRNHPLYLIIIVCAGLLAGCAASIPAPRELINARQAFAHASASPATQLVPAELHKARVALARAEKAFLENPQSYRTQGLANLAYREAKLVEALGVTASDDAFTAEANRQLPSTKTDIMKQE
jgi:hypothetical protein